MNSPALDTLTITIEQKDGDKVLSVLSLQYPNLPNAAANAMQLALVDGIAAITQSWSDEKAQGADPFAQ